MQLGQRRGDVVVLSVFNLGSLHSTFELHWSRLSEQAAFIRSLTSYREVTWYELWTSKNKL